MLLLLEAGCGLCAGHHGQLPPSTSTACLPCTPAVHKGRQACACNQQLRLWSVILLVFSPGSKPVIVQGVSCVRAHNHWPHCLLLGLLHCLQAKSQQIRAVFARHNLIDDFDSW